MPTVRLALDSDASAISTLCAQLGYPAPTATIPARLAALRSNKVSIVLVAEVNGEVVGIITGHVIHSIHDDHPIAQLTTIVVAEKARGTGVGSQLVAKIEEWAKDNGAKRISLTSGIQRHETHKFYENRGYERTGVRFGKEFGT